MTTVADIVRRVRNQLNDLDAEAYRWGNAELIDYVNDGLRQTVMLKPEANVVDFMFTPSDGSPLQQLPDGGLKFIRATFNVEDELADPPGRGAPITFIERDVLDTFQPDWSYAVPDDAEPPDYYRHFMHDPRVPTQFLLFPVPQADYPLWIEYVAEPDEVTEIEDTLPLSDRYAAAIAQYVVYRALMKEGRFELGAEARRQAEWQAYLQALGFSRQVAQSISPEAPQHRPPDQSRGQ